MPGLLEIGQEIADEYKRNPDNDAFDAVRQRYLAKLAQQRGANVILYASAFLQKPEQSPNLQTVSDLDVHGFMEVVYDLDPEKDLELILHSPGGSPEAAESIVDYLHDKFKGRKIRAVVPRLAMSAATMIACAADVIIMGRHSSLGPIDPQIVMYSDDGGHMLPAGTVVEYFKHLLENIQLTGYFFQLQQVPFGQILQLEKAIALSKDLAKRWLLQRMCAGDDGGKKKAAQVAEYLGDHDHFKSHGRRISPVTAHEKGLKVEMLEDAPDYQDAVLSVFHATELTFANTPAAKIIENHKGRRYVQQAAAQR